MTEIGERTKRIRAAQQDPTEEITAIMVSRMPSESPAPLTAAERTKKRASTHRRYTDADDWCEICGHKDCALAIAEQAIDALTAEIATLRRERDQAREALQDLVDEQNGPPLIRDAHSWGAAMDKVGRVLARETKGEGEAKVHALPDGELDEHMSENVITP